MPVGASKGRDRGPSGIPRGQAAFNGRQSLRGVSPETRQSVALFWQCSLPRKEPSQRPTPTLTTPRIAGEAKRHEQDGGEFHEMGGIHMAVGRTDKLTVWIERRRQQVAGCRPNIREINMLERSDSSKPVIRCKKTLLPLTRNK